MDRPRDDLAARVAELEAAVAALTAARSCPAPEEPPDAAASPTLDRRALLGRAGAAVAGAVVAGAGAAALDARPAAAATATFDTSVAATPAVTATVNGAVAGTGVKVNPGSAGTGIWVTGGNNASSVLAYNTSASPTIQGVNVGTGSGVLGSSTSVFLHYEADARGAVTGLNTRGVGPAAGVVGRAEQAPYGWGVAGIGAFIGMGGYGDAYDAYLGRTSTIWFDVPSTVKGPTGSAWNDTGSLSRDGGGDLWFCTASGTGAAGTYRKVSGPGVAGSLHLLATPVRAYDSRLGGQTPLANAERAVSVTTIGPGLPGAGGASGVPTDAVAVLVNLTATETVGAGWFAIWANGPAWPGHSNLNWSSSAVSIANQATSLLGGGKVRIKAAGRADVVLDVFGFYR